MQCCNKNPARKCATALSSTYVHLNSCRVNSYLTLWHLRGLMLLICHVSVLFTLHLGHFSWSSACTFSPVLSTTLLPFWPPLLYQLLPANLLSPLCFLLSFSSLPSVLPYFFMTLPSTIFPFCPSPVTTSLTRSLMSRCHLLGNCSLVTRTQEPTTGTDGRGNVINECL